HAVSQTLRLGVEPAVGCEENTSLPDMECFALMAFADATSGFTDGWGEGDPCEAWEGVLCEDRHVVTVFIWHQELKGAITGALAHLTGLKKLHLTGTDLAGEIPAELGRITGLRERGLTDNDLTGEIPAQLGQITG